MIICASRRTDIPAFHSEWFMNRLRAGTVLVRNPVARNVVHRVSLDRRDVDCILFMTKDPRPMERHLEEIASMGHTCLFQVTMTPYGRDLEPNVPFKADVNDSCIRIAERIGRDRMVWRYDPVVFNGRIGLGYHERKFGMMCREASEWTDRCVFSFVDVYGKLDRFRDAGLVRGVSKAEMEGFARMAVRVSEDFGMSLSWCCPRPGIVLPGVQERGCMDRETLRMLGIPCESVDRPVREGCRCVRSIDIGEYDTCAHGCVYCYANRPDPGGRDARVYDPCSEMLSGGLTPFDRIVELKGRGASRISDYS